MIKMSEYISIAAMVLFLGGWLYIYKIHHIRIFNPTLRNSPIVRSWYADITSKQLFKMLQKEEIILYVDFHMIDEIGLDRYPLGVYHRLI